MVCLRGMNFWGFLRFSLLISLIFDPADPPLMFFVKDIVEILLRERVSEWRGVESSRSMVNLASWLLSKET